MISLIDLDRRSQRERERGTEREREREREIEILMLSRANKFPVGGNKICLWFYSAFLDLKDAAIFFGVKEQFKKKLKPLFTFFCLFIDRIMIFKAKKDRGWGEGIQYTLRELSDHVYL